MFYHKIFQRPDYLEFAARLEQSLTASTTPEEVQLQQAVPLVADRLTVVHRDLRQAVDEQGQTTQARLEAVEATLATTRTDIRRLQASIERVESKFDGLASGQTAFSIRAFDPASFVPAGQTADQVPLSLPPAPSVPTGQTADQVPPSLPPAPSVPTGPTAVQISPPPPAPSVVPTGQPSEPTGQASDPQPLNPPQHVVQLRVVGSQAGTPPTPVYSLSRAVNTVTQLWEEWMVGIEGKPAVKELERLHGPAWRPSSSERVQFSRRKAIVDEIEARVKSGLSPDSAVKEVEESRGTRSLYQLSQSLAKARRGR